MAEERGSPGAQAAQDRGASFAFAAPEGTLSAGSHPSGLHPVYVRQRPDAFALGTSLAAVGGPGREPDLSGVLQHLLWGWTVGRTTHLAGVERVLPGTTRTFATGGATPETPETTVGWHQDAGQPPGQFWPSLQAALEVPPEGMVAVMMSGGWDSRTILAALLEQVPAERILLYAHGNPHSRELSIVRALGARLGCRVHLEPITPEAFTLPRLADTFDRTGNVLFPHWAHAARRLTSLGVRRTYTGVYGELVGGRYGTTTEGSLFQRALATFLPRLGNRPTAGSPVEEILERFTATLPDSRPWFLAEGVWREAAGSREAIRDEARRWLEDESARNNTSLGGLMEAFYLQHRAGQYAGAQPRSFLGVAEWSTPMASWAAIRAAVTIPFPDRVQNRENRRLLRGHRPETLALPTAACLVPARWPVPIQEMSRGLRKATQLVNQLAGRAGRALSWNDFGCLQGAGVLDALVGTFSSDLLDHAEVRARLDRAHQDPATNWHSVADMLLKIANVEWSLRPPDGRAA